MQHFKDPQLRGGWFFYGPYCIKSLESSLLQLTLSVARGLLLSLSIVETNSSFVSTLKQQHHWRCPSFIKKIPIHLRSDLIFPIPRLKRNITPSPICQVSSIQQNYLIWNEDLQMLLFSKERSQQTCLHQECNMSSEEDLVH